MRALCAVDFPFCDTPSNRVVVVHLRRLLSSRDLRCSPSAYLSQPNNGRHRPVPDWLVLQKKIFTRWVNQKLAIRKKVQPIKDVVETLTASAIIELIEVLSEKQFNNKPPVVESTLRVKVTTAFRSLL